ncbi:MAG: hypothetical protein IKK25_03835, partial [Lentisphaeria bacterium]|nr:hypothetical protein [Lentisphaeria bacterium]
DGVASELIVDSGHSVQKSPEAIRELARILRTHLIEAKNAGTPLRFDPVLPGSEKISSKKEKK